MDESKLIKCGFNAYYDKDSGYLYEKISGEFVPIEEGLRGELERSFVLEKLSKLINNPNTK